MKKKWNLTLQNKHLFLLVLLVLTVFILSLYSIGFQEVVENQYFCDGEDFIQVEEKLYTCRLDYLECKYNDSSSILADCLEKKNSWIVKPYKISFLG